MFSSPVHRCTAFTCLPCLLYDECASLQRAGGIRGAEGRSGSSPQEEEQEKWQHQPYTAHPSTAQHPPLLARIHRTLLISLLSDASPPLPYRPSAASEHEFSASYVNTHIRRKGYTLSPASPSSSSSLPSGPSHSQRSAQGGVPPTWDTDEDDNLDDEQGAEWEEWSCERKNEWIEKEVRGLIPCIRDNYVLPTAHRVNTQGDSSVWEGYGGVAMMYFHTAYAILQGLPTQSRAFVPSPSARNRGGGSAGGHTPTKGLSVRNLAVSQEAGDAPSPRSADVRAEQQQHVQRQYAISLLQDAHDYVTYTLALIDKQLEEARDEDSNLVDEDREHIFAAERRCSFIRSKAGVFALAACIFHHRARYLYLHPVTTPNIASKEFDPVECLQQRRQMIEALLQVSTVAQAKGQDDEFFNGRAGYLFALNFVHSHLMGEVERMESGERQEGVQGETKEGQGEEGERKGDLGSAQTRDDSKHQPSPEQERTLMRTDELKQLLVRAPLILFTLPLQTERLGAHPMSAAAAVPAPVIGSSEVGDCSDSQSHCHQRQAGALERAEMVLEQEGVPGRSARHHRHPTAAAPVPSFHCTAHSTPHHRHH